jgi:hypothetical protein
MGDSSAYDIACFTIKDRNGPVSEHEGHWNERIVVAGSLLGVDSTGRAVAGSKGSAGRPF